MSYYRAGIRSRFGKCRSCGAAIIWIRTENGKMMPADAKTERFWPDRNGEKIYITQSEVFT